MQKIFEDFEAVRNIHPNDIAEKLKGLSPEERIFNFYSLPKELKVKVFSYLDSGMERELITALGDGETKELLNKMAPDDRTEFFLDLPDELIKDLINLLDQNQRDVALQLLGYPEDSVARRMTPDYIRVKENWSVAYVFEHIQRYGKIAETLNIIYVVDDNSVLLDDIPIGRFLMADPNTLVSELCDYGFVALTTTMPQEKAAEQFKKYDRSALPVVTTTGVLAGIVTADDMIDVITEEYTEDIHKLGGVAALETPYATISLWNLYKKRVGWLVILFVGELFTATAMGYFENQLEKAIMLALFIPLIISSGGNSGSQASTLIIRALALHEVGLRDWWRILRREIVMGLMLGLTLAAVGFCRIELWNHMGWYDFGQYSHLVALTVGVALIGVVTWGTFSGAMIPLILKLFRLDPATSSAPFVATMVDVTGLIIYFLIAIAILSGYVL